MSKLPTLPPIGSKPEETKPSGGLPKLPSLPTLPKKEVIEEPAVIEEPVIEENDFSADYDDASDWGIVEIDEDGNLIEEVNDEPELGDLLGFAGEHEDFDESIDDTHEELHYEPELTHHDEPKRVKNGELNEEALEEFFANLKAKFTNLFNKNNNKLKHKQDNKPKSKLPIGLIIKSLVVVLVIVLLFIFVPRMFNKGVTLPLTEPITHEVDDLSLIINEAYIENDTLIVDILNNGDISADFDVYATLKNNKGKVLCSSDINVIETGENSALELTCDETLDGEYTVEFSFTDNN